MYQDHQQQQYASTSNNFLAQPVAFGMNHAGPSGGTNVAPPPPPPPQPQPDAAGQASQMNASPLVATGDWTKDLVHLAKTAELK